MRLSWAAHLADAFDAAIPWAAGAAALLVARERLLEGRELNPQASARAAALLGREAPRADSLPEMAARLPVAAAWAIEDLGRPEDLWRGEIHWWRRLDRDGRAMLADSRFRLEPVVGALALLAVDAWRTRAATGRAPPHRRAASHPARLPLGAGGGGAARGRAGGSAHGDR